MKQTSIILTFFLVFSYTLAASAQAITEDAYYEKATKYEEQIKQLEGSGKRLEALKIHRLMLDNELTYKKNKTNRVCFDYVKTLAEKEYNTFKEGVFFMEEIVNKIDADKLLSNEMEKYGQACEETGYAFKAIGRFDKSRDYMVKALAAYKKTEKGENNRHYKALLDENEELAQMNLGLAIQSKNPQKVIDLVKQGASPIANADTEGLNKMLGTTNIGAASDIMRAGLIRGAKQSLIEQNTLNELIKPQYAETLDALANGSLSSENDKKAEGLIQSSIDKLNPTILNPFSETYQGFVLSKLRFNFDANLSYMAKKSAQNPQLAALAYNQALQLHALLLTQQKRIRGHLQLKKEGKTKALYDKWLQKRTYLSQIYLKMPKELTEQGISTYKEQMEYEELEEALNKEAGLTVKEEKFVAWKAVKETLTDKEAAIEIVRFKYFDKKKWTNEVYYAALILRFDSENPRIVVLKNGVDLENSLFKKYDATRTTEDVDKSVYDNYWLPIQKELTNIKRVYVAPDGVYHRINLNILGLATQKHLIDELDIRLLSTTRELVTGKKIRNVAKPSAVLVGNPTFEVANTAPQYAATSPVILRSAYDLSRLKSKTWDNLPKSEAEVIAIQDILTKKQYNVQLFTKAKATETVLKQLVSPTILHLATHGYFVAIDNESLERLTNSDKLKGPEKLALLRFVVDTFAAYQSEPSLHSGLVLAGAYNNAQKTTDKPTEDGLLTAYEVNGLDLNQTELVVLSACETGVGEIKNGEGLYGLQRSFEVAGAGNVIMSLWKVRDDVTQDFMTTFYTYWLQKGLSKQEAFRKTQLDIRAKKRETLYWGGFIMTGL